MSKAVNITDLGGYCAAFGDVGARVAPRTGADKRTQDDTEWFIVRRFLKVALREGILRAPVTVQKQAPPLPDFGLLFESATANVEITEANDPSDQREMTKFELSGNSIMLLGAFGGRFSDGASQPGKTWASDVINAINRKRGKAIFEKSDFDRHLLIYPNSNASSLVNDVEDEQAAFGFLRELIELNLSEYLGITNGCLVHVLGKELIGFDVLGAARLARR